jgi:curli biogenesis system outer membrane secretion channel CsgG
MRSIYTPAKRFLSLIAAFALAGCEGFPPTPPSNTGVKPAFSYPVTSNDTPYSQCLAKLAKLDANNLPVFSVGEVSDKTGQFTSDTRGGSGYAVSQGISEMVISALAKTRKANMVERLDLRIPLAEVKLAEQKRLTRSIDSYGKLPASDFILVGALTELNYNIVSGGTQLFVKGIGGGGRVVVINVALDLRVVDGRNFSIRYVSSLQKQIFGYEVEANVFRFFGNNLIEFDAGAVRNEPMQLGVRSVVEMSVYQIMTDYLGLPEAPGCGLVETNHMDSYLEQISPDGKPDED